MKLFASVLVCLFFVNTPVSAASVYLQNNPGNLVLSDPSHIELPDGSHSTLPNKGISDLGTGTFQAYMDGTLSTGIASSMYSGILSPLIFTNTTASPITIADGNLSAHVEGTYTFGVIPNGSTYAQVNANLQATITGGSSPSVAAVQQTAAEAFDSSGNLVFPNTHVSTSTSDSGGGHSTILYSGLDGFSADLQMPTLVLNPGATMQLYFGLTPAAPGKTAIADFYTKGATLSLTLPAGVSLHSDATVPLTWVTTVPIPAAFWLFGSALAGLIGVGRRKRF